MKNFTRHLYIFSITCGAFFYAHNLAYPEGNESAKKLDYTDPKYCAKCHEFIYAHSTTSDKARMHFYANRKLSDTQDKFAFTRSPISRPDGEYFFSSENNKFKIERFDRQKSCVESLEAKMAIGSFPLVQYIFKGKRGAWQVSDISYSPIEKSWFSSFGEEVRNADEWGHRTGRGMNWNSNCASCHMTGFQKNYNPTGDSYNSKWIDMGVSCLQCHPALPKQCEVPEVPLIKKPKLADIRKAQMFACASCHTRREQLTSDKFKTFDDYFDHFRPMLPTIDGLYYADGQVRDENFMFGSFMMSRQFDAGLTCRDCHDSHSFQTFKSALDNTLCLSCHAPEARNFKNAPTILANEHSFHKDGSGNLCINCHMPQTTYMQKDARYDHGFTSPDPVLTSHVNIPNACTTCHDKLDDKALHFSEERMISEFEKRYGSERFLRKRARASAVAKVYEGKISEELGAEILKLARKESNDFWRATLIVLLENWNAQKEVQVFLKDNLSHNAAIVRAGAVRALSAVESSKDDIAKLVRDPSRLVRLDSAFALREVPAILSDVNLSELLEYLDFNSDSPIGALRSAEFAISKGDFKKAIGLANLAMSLDPSNIELMRECAIMLYKANDPIAARETLLKAANAAPRNAQIQYAIALSYAPENLPLAEKYLNSTLTLEPSFDRAWYNLSLVRLNLKNLQGAREAIAKALQLNPSSDYKHLLNIIETAQAN